MSKRQISRFDCAHAQSCVHSAEQTVTTRQSLKNERPPSLKTRFCGVTATTVRWAQSQLLQDRRRILFSFQGSCLESQLPEVPLSKDDDVTHATVTWCEFFILTCWNNKIMLPKVKYRLISLSYSKTLFISHFFILNVKYFTQPLNSLKCQLARRSVCLFHQAQQWHKTVDKLAKRSSKIKLLRKEQLLSFPHIWPPIAAIVSHAQPKDSPSLKYSICKNIMELRI